MTLSEIKQGDRVRIKKPEDIRKPICWNREGDMDYLDGLVVAVGPIDTAFIPTFEYDSWTIALEWCEKVEEEMTLAQWEEMSPRERLEWNRPAFEALAEGVETLYAGSGSAGWTGGTFVCLDRPCRPKKKPGPPKEVYVTLRAGEVASCTLYDPRMEEFDIEDKHVVKYVIAE